MVEQQNNLDPKIRDTLLDNLSMLSSVFYKTPEQFVKKIRDRVNEKLDLETEQEADVGSGGAQPEYVDSTGVKRSEYLQQNEGQTTDYQSVIGGKQGNLLDLLDDNNAVATGGSANPLDDILGGGMAAATTGPSSNEGSLLDMMDDNAPATMNNQPASGLDLLDNMNMGGVASSGKPVVNTTFVKTPFKPVVQKTQAGNQKQKTGIEVHAAMMRLNQNSSQCIIKLKITNHTVEIIKDFLFKLNVNYFGFTVDQGIPPNTIVAPGTTVETQVLCSPSGGISGDAPQRPPILIQCGLMNSLDLFFFEIPVLAQILFEQSVQNREAAISILDNWNYKSHQPAWSYEIPKMSPQCANPQLLQGRLEKNNVHFVRQAATAQGVPCFLAFVETQLSSRDIVGCEISINV